jgi:preprotein translocase subunit SecE
VARNRKRAKERQARRPQPVASTRADREETPGPIQHAAPDVELAEAQLAIGRPDLAGEPEPPLDLAAEPAEGELEPDPGGGDRRPPSTADFAADTDGAADGDAELAVVETAVTAAPPATGNRLINFIQGSWRELQRVQWPDRRQVMQATGVVIGFVIVAGLFLGVADTLSGKLMDFILK